jgi:hypothetical protein
MKLNERLATWVAIGTLAGMLVGAGIYLGKLQQQFSDYKTQQDQNAIYYHGSVNPPALVQGASK